jgi:ABC-type sugar transport system substrate-binding protein
MRSLAMLRVPLCLAVLACSVVLFAACGDDGESEAASASGGSESATAANAPIVDAPPTTPADEFPITESLDGPPPKKKIAWLACELPTCQSMLSDGYKGAAEALGWDFQQINYKVADPASAVQQALDNNVDYIAITGIPPVAFRAQAEEAAKRGIPIVSCFDPTKPDPKTNGVYMQCADAYGYGLQAKQAADWIINDSEGKANVLMVNIEDYPILRAEREAIQEEFKKSCSGCKFANLPVTVEDVGAGKVTSKMIAYLQSHPDVNYLHLAFSDLGLGVPQALQAAGLADKIKITGVQADENVLKQIVGGKIAAWTAQAQEFVGWLSMDAFARLAKEKPLTEYQQSGQLPSWVVASKEEAQKILDGPGAWPGPEGFKEKFKQLWGV